MTEITRRDVIGYEAELAQLDPESVEERLKAQDKARRRARMMEAQARKDLAELLKLPSFRRYFFTIQGRAGMGMATRHAHDRDYAYDAGRRALGLELTDEALVIDPGFAIDLAVERAKLEESVRRDDE